MLIITRRPGERIVLGDDIVVTVMEISGQTARIGIAAPRELPVYREEIWEAVKAENQAAASVDPSGVHQFTHHAADAGFPSDHATASFAIATAIVLRNRRWGIGALVLATLLSLTRVAIGVHYPSDVLAGAALGAASALALWQPPIRRRLHVLADWAGGVLDGALARVRQAAR